MTCLPIATQSEAEAGAANDSLMTSLGSGVVGFGQSQSYSAGTIGRRLQQEIWVPDAPFSADPTGAIEAALATQDAVAAVTAVRVQP